MSLKRRVDRLDGGEERDLTQDDWIYLLDALEKPDPIAAIRASPICKRFMDTATMRKRGNRGTTSRQVCVTSISTLRSGVRGNGAPRNAVLNP